MGKRFMKKLGMFILSLMILLQTSSAVFAIQETGMQQKQKPIVYNKNARAIKYAFVFDGPSDKNNQVLKQFQTTITRSTAPDYRAEYPQNLIFVGNWTKESVKEASEKAINSNATMVVSLGYLSTQYYNNLKDKKKFVITIDQYGLRDFGDGFFNPVQQSVKGIYAFQKLVNFKKIAILMNENYYNTRKDWHKFLAPKLQNIDYVIGPATKDIDATYNRIPKDVDAVVLTPLFNLSLDERKHLIRHLNE